MTDEGCGHDLAEMDTAVHCDGLCPLCLCAALRPTRDAVNKARRELAIDRAVCICGCSPEQHESYDEDGESCDMEDHECLRVCVTARDIVACEREKRQQAENELESVRDVMNEAERRLGIYGTPITMEQACLDERWRKEQAEQRAEAMAKSTCPAPTARVTAGQDQAARNRGAAQHR
jgi:hypothetical protein